DGQLMASGLRDGRISVWDIKTQQRIHVLEGHHVEVTAVAFNPDGSRLVTGAIDGSMIVWQPLTGLEVLNLRGIGGSILGLSFDRDGRRLMSANGDSVPGEIAVRIWG